MTLQVAWKMMLQRGGLPVEVQIDREGSTLPTADALKKNLQWDVIFFREDGYTIAADYYLAPYVRSTHQSDDHQWIGKMYRGDVTPKGLDI